MFPDYQIESLTAVFDFDKAPDDETNAFIKALNNVGEYYCLPKAEEDTMVVFCHGDASGRPIIKGEHLSYSSFLGYMKDALRKAGCHKIAVLSCRCGMQKPFEQDGYKVEPALPQVRRPIRYLIEERTKVMFVESK